MRKAYIYIFLLLLVLLLVVLIVFSDKIGLDLIKKDKPTTGDDQGAGNDNGNTPAPLEDTPAPQEVTVADQIDVSVPLFTPLEIADLSLTGVLVARAALRFVGPRIARRVAPKIVARVVAYKTIKMAVFRKSLQRAALLAAQKFGYKAMSQATLRQLTTAAFRVGRTAKAAGSAFTAFSVMSLVLDLSDIFGDTVGYSKMGTKQVYLALKKSLDEEFKKILKSKDIDGPPIFVGPFHFMDYVAAIEIETGKILDLSDQSKVHVLAKPMMNAIVRDVENGTLEQEDLSNDAIMKKYDRYLDMDAIARQAVSNACILYGGKEITFKGARFCTFKDKDTCMKHSTFPLENESDMFLVWRNDACHMESQAMKQICTDNNLEYDQERGICKITKQYCQSKGAEYTDNPMIKEKDCMIPPEQEAMELIFGKTVVRGLKQVFDGDQYKPCIKGEFETGTITCGRCPDSHPELNGALCYKPCKKGYKGVGPVCWWECPDGFRDDGAFCAKPTQWHSGLFNCPEGYESTGFWCQLKYKCPDRNDTFGASCTKDSYGRGVGVPFLTRVKERKIRFSSGQN